MSVVDKENVHALIDALSSQNMSICEAAANELQKLLDHIDLLENEAKPDEWNDMETAPRDGTEILVARNNGVDWEYDIVYYGGNFAPDYPWHSDKAAYPEGRLDYWKPIDEPYDATIDLWGEMKS